MKIGLISDIHEDILSLEQAFRFFSSEKCDQIFCLGDIVGFALPFFKYIETRNANECIRLIKENCTETVIGNHDLFAIKKVPKHKFGFDYGNNWYSLDYDERAKKSKERIWLYEDNEIKSVLNDESIEFLNKLPEVSTIQFDNFSLLISHFCYPDFTGSAIYFPRESFHLQKHFDYMKNKNCSLSISGHGHTEGIISVNEDSFRCISFGEYSLADITEWIVIPCVARTTRLNGLAILDTSKQMLSTFRLTI
jgi:predicted phosphodiesterase